MPTLKFSTPKLSERAAGVAQISMARPAVLNALLEKRPAYWTAQ